ncbi:superfamily II DNA/RNA helicase [Microbacteriaceae bacterium SG_E_30_P1]|uniref:Superfamily II DNA/RNA helicase n=1 Tax=Antiquaquibacter oligotrophicus TaxID=2880260 RepID=A0ABT6KJ19_9MICO|nr:DEAD/DEAH box helicase [Antiquaquibacter oligotrophicus]MDH6179870.1 superfamily II DNA/RNA helicase [Antiquaquibacter oligotrophicus]UDF14369.1 DEAD/DEAH box helicase [Antiquaquibacter oligotrophicus]
MSSTTFGALGVPAPLVAVLEASGKTEPFPIQQDTLPDTLAGRDVLGRGKTGSGKTLAFAIPMVARLAASGRQGRKPRGLILAPTRELATQISATLEPLASAGGLTITTIFGGVSQQRQVAALKAGVDIVVACPGRLEDLMQQGFAHLDQVEITVLDEADHMADLGFLPGVTRIMNATPSTGQRLLFSATLDNGVDKLVARFLRNQVLHSVDEATSHVAAMTHHLFEVADADAKRDVVEALASGTGRRILFMRTKHHAKRLAKQLTAAGIPSVDLHGNLSQPQRDRNLAAFSDGSARVLVATDVAARGVHVDGVELVVHVDPPAEHKAYLHRSGRTARAGSEGDVVTVMLPTQRGDTLALLRKAAIKVAPQSVTAGSEPVVSLVGEVAPRVTPAPVSTPARGRSQGGTSQGANAQRKRAARDARGQGDSAGGGSRGSRSRRGGAAGAAGAGRAGGAAQAGGARGAGRAGGAGAAQESRGRAAASHGTRGQGGASSAAPQRTAAAPSGSRPRGGKGRAQAPAGGIRVGSVVRPNVRGR